MFYVYMLRCEDDSLYTGITTDVMRRMKEHLEKGNRAARYTRWHTARELEAVWQCGTRKQAARLEYWVKRLSKQKKEQLILDNDLARWLGEQVNGEDYTRCDVGALFDSDDGNDIFRRESEY